LKGLVISRASGTADTPRAHTFNPFAFECLRDIGIEDIALQQATRGPVFQSMRWSRSLIGEEYGKVRAWGEDPSSMGNTAAVSPCEYAELTQSQLEPLLVRYISHHNFNVRFSTEIIGIERVRGEKDTIFFICTVHDHISDSQFKIRTRFLFGADGARSHVAHSLGFSFISKPSGKKACNVLFRADLGHLMCDERRFGINWVLNPERTTFFGLVAQLRVVRPWKEWILVAFGQDDSNPFDGMTPQNPELIDCIREVIGDHSINIEILRLDPWTVRESIAEEYSVADANAFLLGDAAHRHPPAFGLGSNTCVQDTYNLAWKVAYVSRGFAGPKLLSSYTKERQPVGDMLVREANNGIRAHVDVWGAVGMFAPSPEEGAKQLSKLSEPTVEGANYRERLHTALDQIGQELRSLGAAYNQWYISTAVYLDDEADSRPLLRGNPITDIQISTYPGSRVPHAWVDVPTRGKMISTQDLAGKGAFCLFFGVGGHGWKTAAKKISSTTGIPINVYGIGFGLDYIDVYRDWYSKRGVEDGGCVLVRPDRFVAWRSSRLVPDCESKLMHVLNTILCRDEL
ncbi:hypothetical protein Plec18167_007223, partial [Paecilomyces lecythidis]